MARLVAAFLCSLIAGPAMAGPLLVDFLDIGQGDAILIRGGGKTVLIDAGDRKSDTGRQLRDLDVDRIDLVIATHPHADHIGRMPEVLDRFDVGLYLDNGMTHTTETYEATMALVESTGVQYGSAHAGMEVRMGDEALLTVLNPTQQLLTGTRSDLNSNSVVVRLDHDEVSFLFTGDAEEPTEYRLMSAGLEPVTVLKVAHHGSRHSSSPSFVSRTTPQFAVISVGADNRYKHPSDETISRLEAAGAHVYRTDLSGHVRAYSDGTSVEFLEGSLRELGPGRELLGDQPAVVAAPPPPEREEAPPEVPPVPAPVDEAETKAQLKARRKAEKKRKKSKWPIESVPPPSRKSDRT